MDFNTLLKDSKLLSESFPEMGSVYPEDPLAFFKDWFKHAYENNVLEPAVMTLSTVDDNAHADSRIVALKAVDETGFIFETPNARQKVIQIRNNKNVALNFYWKSLGRQIRIRGHACQLLDFSHVAGNLDASERDLTVYRVVPNVIEFYQTLNEGGNSRVKYKLVKQEWAHEVL
ncbi:pyridoxamine 5'-phosphate oxidase family protein [Salinicoccus albus]|uniref:pyridoxamine 5'-phosphate oxidase family protein n=1 Tax=Salinicoccus albus TaxID=418756 RepID=UPI0003689F3F|nr:pyridoxamine 5'-phosphate oxidase family protein [Salinicoccus albus]